VCGSACTHAFEAAASTPQVKDDLCRRHGYSGDAYDLCFRLAPMGRVKSSSSLGVTLRQLLAAPHGRALGREPPLVTVMLSRRDAQVGGGCGG
jgi:hypothetical protein